MFFCRACRAASTTYLRRQMFYPNILVGEAASQKPTPLFQQTKAQVAPKSESGLLGLSAERVRRLELPSGQIAAACYTFPEADERRRVEVALPTALGLLSLEILAPCVDGQPLEYDAPAGYPVVEKSAASSFKHKIIRSLKMHKHKWRKSRKKNFFRNEKMARDKAIREERTFRTSVRRMIGACERFDAEQEARETVAAATAAEVAEPMKGLRKRHPHWSTLMTLEELYGLPPTDYIDKNAGMADEEDAAEMHRLKADYYRRWRRIDIDPPAESTESTD